MRIYRIILLLFLIVCIGLLTLDVGRDIKAERELKISLHKRYESLINANGKGILNQKTLEGDHDLWVRFAKEEKSACKAPETDACYKAPSGEYVWGKYGNDSKYELVPGVTSKVVLDHNHITGKPRAWICDSCNTGLGRFKDDIKTMEDAIAYLKKYK